MPPVPRQTPVGSSRRFAHLSLRLLLLLIGMFTAALGVALTTVADLGTTPISTVPYVFTVLTGYSFGTTTFFVNIFLVAAPDPPPEKCSRKKWVCQMNSP